MRTILLLFTLFYPAIAFSQDQHRKFYDTRNNVTHTWTRYDGSDTTIVRDNTNRVTGYRQRFGDRIEIRDNTNRIIGYEDAE